MTKKNHGYENANIHVELREKNQQIVALKKRYVGYLANEDKSSGTTIIAKSNEEAKYPYISISFYVYLYIDTRSGCYWHKIKVAPYLQKDIHQMPSFCITFGESIG